MNYIAKLCKTVDEAVIKLFEENVLPYLKKFDSQAFRLSKLYKETCDIVIRTHWETLKDIYLRAATLDARPDQDEIMSINEFTKFVIATIQDDDSLNLNTREIGPLFNLSMMT